MNLHRRLADAEIKGNLFAEAASCDLNHDLALTGSQRFEAFLERIQDLFILPSGAIPNKAELDRVEEVLIAE